NSFDTTTDALLKLKSNGISDDMINVMNDASYSKLAVNSKSNDPLAYHQSGIYLLTEKKDLVQIDYTVPSGTGTEAAANQLLGNIFNAKRKVTLSGSSAHLTVDSSVYSTPFFYFYFEPAKSNLNSASDWIAQNAVSPNEFMLVKAMIKDN